MIPLYEIVGQLKGLENIAISDDLPPEVIRDTLEALQGSFEVKAVAVAKFICNLEASAAAIDIAASEMQARGARVKRRAEAIRAYLMFQMQAVDVKRIDTPELVIARRENPPALVITDEDAIPAIYFVTPEPVPRLDKAAVKQAIKDGASVPGCHVERGERLELK